MTQTQDNINKIAQLNCWSTQPDIPPLTGGITNQNFIVTDGDEKYVVRLGRDILEQLVLHCNELASAHVTFKMDVDPVEIIFGDTDLLAVNIIDNGPKIRLIDIDYADFNSLLFDLSNPPSNNELSRQL